MKRRIYNLKAKNSERLTQNMIEKMQEVLAEIDLANIFILKGSDCDRCFTGKIAINIKPASSLINTCFNVIDSWNDYRVTAPNNIRKSNQIKSIVLLKAYIRSLFQIFLNDKEMQNIITSTLHKNNPDLDELSIRVEKRRSNDFVT